MEQEQKTVSLVLSSGGARGMAHLGVIEEIEKLGWKINVISGCSMGAAVGGMYAAGKLHIFKEWMCTLDKMDVYRLMDFTLSSKGFIKGDKVFQEMEQIIGGDRQIQNLPIKYFAAATNFETGKAEYFESGSLLSAIRASVAVPTVVTPFQWKNHTYIDGGVVVPIPILPILNTKNDLLIIVNANARSKYIPPKLFTKEKALEESYAQKMEAFISNWWNNKNQTQQELGYFSLMTGTIEIMMDKLSENILDKVQPDILIEIPRVASGMMEFYKSAELIEAGREAFIKASDLYFKQKRKAAKVHET